jgi:hypothetical protein
LLNSDEILPSNIADIQLHGSSGEYEDITDIQTDTDLSAGKYIPNVFKVKVRVVVSNATFNNISVISWWSAVPDLPLVKVYNIFNTVIVLSHLSCHNALYFLNNYSVVFLTQLHSISEYCSILNTPSHLCLKID